MAVIATGRDILDSLEKIVDIAAWTRLYPLLAAGAACAVGFVGGCLLKPRHRHEARRHWQAIKAGWQEAETPSAEPTTNGATRPDDQSDWGATLIKELVKTVRPALLALIASAIAGARQTHDPEHQPPESRTE